MSFENEPERFNTTGAVFSLLSFLFRFEFSAFLMLWNSFSGTRNHCFAVFRDVGNFCIYSPVTDSCVGVLFC